MSEIRRRKGRVERIIAGLVALIVTALISSIITWYVNENLSNSVKTKIFDYTYVDIGEEEHINHGDVECWVNGVGSRSDVYKCSQGNRIYVPCFRDDISNKVKCPRSPKTNDEAKYFNAKFTDETKPLMSTYGEEATPWYIYLESGEECGFLYGATTTIANKRLDFSCKDSPLTLYLPTKEVNGIVTISCMKNNHLEECKVKEMWR